MKTYIRFRGIAALMIVLLAGCATPPPIEDRYLTLEQDQMLREACEPHGCIAVPAPLMDRILKALPKQRDA